MDPREVRPPSPEHQSDEPSHHPVSPLPEVNVFEFLQIHTLPLLPLGMELVPLKLHLPLLLRNGRPGPQRLPVGHAKARLSEAGHAADVDHGEDEGGRGEEPFPEGGVGVERGGGEDGQALGVD